MLRMCDFEDEEEEAKVVVVEEEEEAEINDVTSVPKEKYMILLNGREAVNS